MFFMMGITEGRKELKHHQVVICNRCGAYGQYAVFIYRLEPEIGRRIEKGEDVEICAEHLQGTGQNGSCYKRCGNCGFTTTEDFEYCPKCGRRF